MGDGPQTRLHNALRIAKEMSDEITGGVRRRTPAEVVEYTHALAIEAINAMREAVDAVHEAASLALAHDQQPYPTAAAYEAVCQALEKSRRALATTEGRGAVAALREMADDIDKGPTFPLPPSVISALVREKADRLAASLVEGDGERPNSPVVSGDDSTKSRKAPDLMANLRASIERAKAQRGDGDGH